MASARFNFIVQNDSSVKTPKETADASALRKGDTLRDDLEQADSDPNDAAMTALDRAIFSMAHRAPGALAEAQARAMETYKPVRKVPAGQTLADIVSGKWPGDESDEQINAALCELS